MTIHTFTTYIHLTFSPYTSYADLLLYILHSRIWKVYILGAVTVTHFLVWWYTNIQCSLSMIIKTAFLTIIRDRNAVYNSFRCSIVCHTAGHVNFPKVFHVQLPS